jgi:hypothetical protein
VSGQHGAGAGELPHIRRYTSLHTAMQKLRIVILGFGTGATENGPWMMDESKTPGTIVDRAAI